MGHYFLDIQYVQEVLSNFHRYVVIVSLLDIDNVESCETMSNYCVSKKKWLVLYSKNTV